MKKKIVKLLEIGMIEEIYCLYIEEIGGIKGKII